MEFWSFEAIYYAFSTTQVNRYSFRIFLLLYVIKAYLSFYSLVGVVSSDGYLFKSMRLILDSHNAHNPLDHHAFYDVWLAAGELEQLQVMYQDVWLSLHLFSNLREHPLLELLEFMCHCWHVSPSFQHTWTESDQVYIDQSSYFSYLANSFRA